MDGSVWRCGADGLAQLLYRSPVPPLDSATGCVFVQIACGGAHTLALTRDGRLFAWGANGRGQLGLGDDVNRLKPVEVDVERASAMAG